ncbi:ABC transporter ATP-binding protein [Desulfogranum japonicum]|uniref:ABC transporter ATP-binding protein n=1 Tax=Desulfogranum japonicum TaxID=231447 RepID=UPI00042317E5|nr:ABC transporter ATP-binding protein [Desulfogranum japonicum]
MRPRNTSQEQGNPLPALEAREICKQYRGTSSPALDNLTLTIQQGDFFGLLGVNGAGKTTAVSIFSGLALPDTGTATVLGYDVVSQAGKIKQLTGLVPQDIALYDPLTAWENLSFFGKLQGLRGATLQQQIERSLTVAGLVERARDQVTSFSGGMKRRLNLAAGLIHQPQVLILDEPTVGVDTQSRHMIHNALLELNSQGTTILYTGHYLEEIEKLCSRIGVIDHGKMIAMGTPQELLHNSNHKNLEELFLQLTGKQVRD